MTLGEEYVHVYDEEKSFKPSTVKQHFLFSCNLSLTE